MRWTPFLLAVALVACFRQPPALGDTRINMVYDRSEWGRWSDEDNDCQDTRQEVLIAESVEPPVLDPKGCAVVSGKWVDPYTGKTYTDPSDLDVDHMVPLKAAHDAGAYAWPLDKKKTYFNDVYHPQHLIAVGASANRSKGARGPSEWLPDVESYRCQYIKDWVTVKERWGLKVDYEAMTGLLILYCGD